MKYSAQNNVRIINQKTTLRDEIAAIVKGIAEGDKKYWGYPRTFHLDQEAVIADILSAVVEHDGEEVMEVFGEA